MIQKAQHGVVKLVIDGDWLDEAVISAVWIIGLMNGA